MNLDFFVLGAILGSGVALIVAFLTGRRNTDD